MREESHLDDMRSAIRGDFERLERRRGAQELMQVRDATPGPAPEPQPEHDMTGAEAGPEPEPEVVEAPRRSWLARIFQP